MDQWPPGVLLTLLVAVLAIVTGLLFWVIRFLRQSSRRYRWFELFVGLFQTSIGFVLLLRVPREFWPWWWVWFAGLMIWSGGYGLGDVAVRSFSRRVNS